MSTIQKPHGSTVFEEVRRALELPGNAIAQAINGGRVVSWLEQRFGGGFGSAKPEDDQKLEAAISRKSNLRRMVIRAVLNGR